MVSYQKAVELNEQDTLTYYTLRANNKRTDQVLFADLTLKQIIQNISRTFVDIINDLVSGQVQTKEQFIMTFFGGDRMIYIGTLLVLIAFIIFITDII
jgi:hypothetical protein